MAIPHSSASEVNRKLESNLIDPLYYDLYVFIVLLPALFSFLYTIVSQVWPNPYDWMIDTGGSGKL